MVGQAAGCESKELRLRCQQPARRGLQPQLSKDAKGCTTACPREPKNARVENAYFVIGNPMLLYIPLSFASLSELGILGEADPSPYMRRNGRSTFKHGTTNTWRCRRDADNTFQQRRLTLDMVAANAFGTCCNRHGLICLDYKAIPHVAFSEFVSWLLKLCSDPPLDVLSPFEWNKS
eukprot:4048328-Amphidinium_carterae.1